MIRTYYQMLLDARKIRRHRQNEAIRHLFHPRHPRRGKLRTSIYHAKEAPAILDLVDRFFTGPAHDEVTADCVLAAG